MSQAVISRPASVLNVAPKSSHGVPNLPEIQHPLSRLGNPDKLNVRGLSSQQGHRPFSNPVNEPQMSFAAPRLSLSAGAMSAGEAARRSLPRIPRPFANIPEGVEVVEAEDQTKTRLPVFGSRADLASRADNRAVSVASRMSRPETRVRLEVDEIEMILREKVKKSYFELRKLFVSNDPEGRGIVSREALNRILITYAGRFISTKQFNALLARFRLHEHKVIKLEEFYACLRETVTRNEMPAWMDPVNRGPGDKITMSATQVHAQLKEKARQRFVDVAEMIPQMNPGGTGRILKPEFRNVLNKMLFFMDEDEFEKLWNRYDTDGLGVIKGERLMNKLGISLRSGTAMPDEDGVGFRLGAGSPELSPRGSPRRPRRLEVERSKSLDIERWLKDKFRQGFHKMKKDFEKYDIEKKGEVELAKFREVLERYDLKLDKLQLDAFLSRCNLAVHPKTRCVSYLDFLQRFQDRSDAGLPHKILLNPEHMYNRSVRADSPGAATNVTAAEAKMMGLFQTDFLALLGVFHKIDKLRTNVISQQEFRAAIQSRYDVDMSDEEFGMFIDRLPLDDEGNVKYVDFMADFDTRGGVAPSLLDTKSVYRSSSPEGAAMDQGPPGLRDSFEEVMDFEDFKKGRPLKEISAAVKALLRDRFTEVEEAFRELDEQNSKHMSQEMMYRMFKKLNMKPEITRGEIRRLWDTFITSQNRTYSFLEFIRHFGYSMKSAAFPNAKVSPPKRGDSDFLIRSRKLNCAADMLEDNLRSKVDYMWDDLRKEFLGLDVYGTGFVSKEEFRDVLQELCVHLSAYELDALSSKFEINHDGRVSYVEFLKPFAMRKQTHRYGNNMLSLLTHPQAEVPIAPIVNEPSKGLSGITARLRQRLVGDWRTLRRAFKKIDLGHTGYLSLPEFRNVLRLCNTILDEDEVYHVMSEFDEKMDGKINYNKFLTETFNADVKAP